MGQRWRMARMLLEAAKSTAWPDPDRVASAVAADRLATAYSVCLERLPAILEERRKEPEQACPAWAVGRLGGDGPTAHAGPAVGHQKCPGRLAPQRLCRLVSS